MSRTTELYKQTYEHFKVQVPNIISLIVILLVYQILRYLGFKGLWTLLVVSVGYFAIIQIWSVCVRKNAIQIKQTLIDFALIIATIFSIYFLLVWLGKYGFYGLIIFYVGYAFYRMFGRKAYRKAFFDGMGMIESMIWGKPLKQFKKDGEKIPKLKFIFKKEK